jgi:hypothetical protein
MRFNFAQQNPPFPRPKTLSNATKWISEAFRRNVTCIIHEATAPWCEVMQRTLNTAKGHSFTPQDSKNIRLV